MKDYLQTVTGPVAREDMGLTLWIWVMTPTY